MKVESPKKHEMDIGLILFFVGILIVATIVLLPASPQISQTILIVGLSVVAVWAAVLGQ